MLPPEEQARIREFVQALNEEIAAIQGGGRTVTVYDGRFKRREAQFFVYVFTTESPLVVVDDAPAKIEVNGRQFDGQVVSVQASEVAVGIKHDFGETIREARLIINLAFLLEALRKRYEEVLNGQRQLDTRLAQRLFGSAPVTSGIDRDELYLPPSTPAPNDEQITAIRAACGSEIHFIWGPPGTGKTTHAIGFLIAVLLRRNLRVLVVAHTNVATDNAIDSAAKLLQGTEDYQNGKLVRFGNISPNVDLPEMVVLDRITDHWGQQQREQIVRLQAQLAQIRAELDGLRLTSELLSQLEEAQKRIARLQTDLQRCVQEDENLKTREGQLTLKLEGAKAKLTEAQAAGRLKRLFRGLDPVKLQSRVSRLQSELNAVRNAISANRTRQNEVQAAIERETAEVERCGSEVRKLFSRHRLEKETFRERLGHLTKQEQKITAQIRAAEEQLAALRAKVLREAKVIATSLTKATTDSQLDDQKFDVLVVDEASVAPLPSLYFAACRAAKKVVAVGDFRQLPPICTGKTDKAQKWLARDIFSEARVQQAVDDERPDSRLTLLRRQYRMHPDICAVPNAIFYQGKLVNSISGPELQNIDCILNRSPFGPTPLVLCDVSSANPWSSRLKGRGRYNLYSAALSAELAKRVAHAGIADVGVISPYRLQARLIKKMLDDSSDEKLRHLKVSNVHKFQGLEQEVIIFDVAEGPPVQPWFANGVELSSDSARLINVSITRPRAQLIIVANVKYLERTLKGNAVLLRIFEKIRHLGGRVMDSQEILRGYFGSDFERWAHLLVPQPSGSDLNDSTPYTEHNFYRAFFTDLRKAEKEIIIVSPFLSEKRCQQFFELFRLKIAKGVEVKLITRPLGQVATDFRQIAVALFDQMRRLGVKVVERQGAHQKFAVIDRKILWEGSLNILSRSLQGADETQEHMRRFGSWDKPATKTCEELIKLHRLA